MVYKSPIQGWRQYQKRYSLQGVVCVKCNARYYPQKYLCSCGSTEFETQKFSDSGTLISFTNVSNPSTEFKNYPNYIIGLIKLHDGPIIMTQIVDVNFEDLKIGMFLNAVFRKFNSNGEGGVVEYGIKFAPKDNA